MHVCMHILSVRIVRKIYAAFLVYILDSVRFVKFMQGFVCDFNGSIYPLLFFPYWLLTLDWLHKIVVMHSVFLNFNCIFMHYTWLCNYAGHITCFIQPQSSFIFYFWGKAIDVQVVWLKVELCKLLEQNKASVLRWMNPLLGFLI